MEVASGTGEHAATFATLIANCIYQPTDPIPEMQSSIADVWCKDMPNVLPPITVDVANIPNLLSEDMRDQKTDVLICINMIHISAYVCTEELFQTAKSVLKCGGFVLLYGPYRENGQMVASNVEFDISLKTRNPEWGIRDIEDVTAIANKLGFHLESRCEMPANNLTLIFRNK